MCSKGVCTHIGHDIRGVYTHRSMSRCVCCKGVCRHRSRAMNHPILSSCVSDEMGHEMSHEMSPEVSPKTQTHTHTH